jgi:hypothetical protein
VRPVSRCERKGPWILVRRRRWFQDRLEEIPARILDRWAQDLRQTSAFSSDDLGRLAVELRKEQIRHFPSALRPLGVRIAEEYSYLVPMNYDFLHAWGSLPLRQRESLRQGKQLAFRSLPADARRSLEALFARRSREEEFPMTNTLQQSTLEAMAVKQKVIPDEEQPVGVWLGPDGAELHRSPLPKGMILPEATLGDRAFKLSLPGGSLHYFYAISPSVRVQPGGTSAAN